MNKDSDFLPDVGWTEQSPEDAEVDSRADAIEQAEGIGEEPAGNTSVLRTLVLPVLLGGIFLIFAFWAGFAWLGML
ncbi:hypothetical protein [Acetobacter nitrogenifigens]|uniref:Uncharacterized protein n=1 Tax=Acetobacter nitrogenifigens DSM 23921 = NBRC 105050 TaxID=1120919 RepID=A0A511XCT1_9PROT|nr:hypothetical protein [Acetobacter nitrogenifigens]GEN60752.1 hypothetical protein ANI02nite_26360 [Acetobacter nitrogenifigens DSM 23921 = NBRC 105050]